MSWSVLGLCVNLTSSKGFGVPSGSSGVTGGRPWSRSFSHQRSGRLVPKNTTQSPASLWLPWSYCSRLAITDLKCRNKCHNKHKKRSKKALPSKKPSSAHVTTNTARRTLVTRPTNPEFSAMKPPGSQMSPIKKSWSTGPWRWILPSGKLT